MATEEEPGVESSFSLAGDPRDERNAELISDRDRVAAALFDRPIPQRTVGRYRVLRRLGEGAMGVVYEGLDADLDRRVALKLIRKDVWDGGDAVLRFQREAQALARLSHPNVVAIYEIGEHEEQLFIAMELVKGQTLRAWLDERPRSWMEINEVFVQAGRGLQAAHEAGLVHRDFKPANCLVGAEGRVRVLDFGLARGTADQTLDSEGDTWTPSAKALDATVTATGALVGTPAYMAPEQLRSQIVTAASDQFAFGVALYEAWIGVRPFSGSSAYALYQNIQSGMTETSDSSARPPAGLLELIGRSLQPAPSDRHADMKVLVDALERFPIRQRRRRLAIAIAGLATVGATTAVAASGEAPCEAADHSEAPGWSQQDRNSTREAVVGGRPDAAALWRTTEAELDAWAERWTAARSASCHAALVEGQTTPAIYDRQVACLDRYGRTASKLIGGLQRDAHAWEHAPRVVDALPDLERCSRPESVLAVEPPAPSERAAVQQARDTIDAASAAWTRGEGAEATRLADEAVRITSAVHYPPLAAEVGVVRGTIMANALEGDREGVLLAAWSDAELAGDDFTATDAAMQLIDTALLLEQRETTKRWLVLAEAKVSRVGGGAAYEARLALSAAALARLSGDHTAADLHSQRALDLLASSVGTDGFAYANALGFRALSVEQAKPRARAVAAHDEAVQAARDAVGAHPLLATALRNRGGFRLESGAFVEAVQDFDEAIGILEHAELEEGALLNARLFKLQAVSMRGDLDLAALAEAAAPLEALPQQHPARIEAMGLKAAVLQRLGHLDDALSAYDDLIALLAQRPETPEEDLALLHSNAAECLLAQKRLPQAKARFERSLRTLERVLEPGDGRFAYPRAGLGNLALQQDKPAKAREHFERALPLARENAGDRVTLANVLWGLAQTLRLLGESPGLAQSLAHEAAKHFRALGQEGDASLQQLETWLDATPNPLTPETQE